LAFGKATLAAALGSWKGARRKAITRAWSHAGDRRVPNQPATCQTEKPKGLIWCWWPDSNGRPT